MKNKFRGKSYVAGEWHFGAYFHNTEVDEYYILTLDDGEFKFCQVDPETVGQWIGIDKNKIDVYEDDIIMQEGVLAVVKWNEEFFEFDTTYGDLNKYTLENDCEKVGNKFDDNIELLEEEKK